MNLFDVYVPENLAVMDLYDLLGERTEQESISHKEMPSYEQHCKFVESMPYPYWHMIEEGSAIVGSIYLTVKDEIGLFIFNAHKGKGYGKAAINLLMEMYPRDRYLANINPNNEASKAFFSGLGFTTLQETLSYKP